MVGEKPNPKTYLLVAITLGLLVVPLVEVAPASASGNPVGQIVADIASLPFAQPNSCQGVISAIQGGGLVEQDLNQALGTTFQPIAVTPDECTLLVTFIPIVGSYNDLIVAAQQYNPNNQTSVNNFYEKAFLLAAEVTIVGIALDGTLYKASFQSTGELNDALKLGKLRSLCGDACYSDVLSSLYWFIKGTASSLLDDFMGWAASYLTNTNQIGAFEPEQDSFLLLLLMAILGSFFYMRRSRDDR